MDPECLRTALGICLHSTTPVAVYWGSELIARVADRLDPAQLEAGA
jgi:hypothetical protein